MKTFFLVLYVACPGATTDVCMDVVETNIKSLAVCRQLQYEVERRADWTLDCLPEWVL